MQRKMRRVVPYDSMHYEVEATRAAHLVVYASYSTVPQQRTPCRAMLFPHKPPLRVEVDRILLLRLHLRNSIHIMLMADLRVPSP